MSKKTQWKSQLVTRNSPAVSGAAAVPAALPGTPAEILALPVIGRGLWVGGAGDLTVVLEADDAAVTLVGVPAGTYLPLTIKMVVNTTTATSIVVFQ